jgi:chromosome segregation ATPase
LREGATALSAMATNTASADDEEKQLRARLDELGAQIKDVQAQLQKKLDAKPEFKKAKTKLEEDQAAYKALVEKKKELMERRGPIQMKIWKIKQLMNQERIKAEAKAKADEKAKGDDKAKMTTDEKPAAPIPPPSAPVQP